MGKNQGKDLLAVSYTTAITIAEGKSVDEINVLSTFFLTIGDALALIAAKTQLCDDIVNTKTD